MVRKTHIRRTGAVLIYVLVSFPLMVGFCSLAVDLGHVQVAKTQLRRSADAAALYAVSGVSDGTAVAKALQAAQDNLVDGTPLNLKASDVAVGTWVQGSGFTAGGTSPNAVKVAASRTATRGSAISLAFAQILGFGTCDVHAQSIAARAAGGSYGIVGLTRVTLSGSAHTDSFNSLVSSYSPGSAANNGDVATNGYATLSGSAHINGTLYQLAGQSTATSGGAIIDKASTLNAPLNYPAASAGSAAVQNDNGMIPASYLKNGGLSLSGSQTLALPAGIYYFSSLTLSGGSSLSLNGAVTIYVTGKVDLSGSVVVAGNLAGNFHLTTTSTSTVTISGSSALYAVVYAPQSPVTISGSGGFFGAVVGATLDLSGSGGVHSDQALATNTSVALVQ